MALEPHYINADRELLPNNRVRNVFSVAPVNYTKQGDSWHKIDTSIGGDRTVTKFPASVEFPSSSQGWTNLSFDSGFSIRRKTLLDGDGTNAEPDFEMSLSVETDHNVTGVIGQDGDGSRITYADAWDGADLILGAKRGKSTRIEKLVRINSMPSGSSEFVTYSFRLRSSQARIWVGENYDQRPWDGSAGRTAELLGGSAFVARSDSEIRGAILDTPSCWYTSDDGQIVREPVRVTFEIQSDLETVVATKHVPRSMIASAVAAGVPLYTDATFKTDDPGATGTDHVAYWSGADTFANAKAASGTGWSDQYMGYENAWWISSGGTSSYWDRIQRCFIFFDTSAASGTVTDAEIDVHYHGASDNFTLFSGTNIYGSTSTGTTSGAASDYQTAQSTAFSSAIAWPGTAGWNTFTLNASGLAACDVDGYSRFCLASVKDLGASPPTWSANKDAYWQIRFDEYAGDYGPRLDLTTVEPSLPMAIAMHHYNNQRAT